MEAYLDNSATTRVFDVVRDVMVKMMMEDYGNPSSMHLMGWSAENHIKEARNIIASSLRVSDKEILFTSGGTESNNMAIIGTAMANRRAGMHIITTSIEHASVLSPMKFLEENGFEVTYLPVDERGQVKLDELTKAMRQDTILVSVMYVNNEIGAVQPIAEINKIIRLVNPNVVFHVDAIQAYGKMEIFPKRLGIDLLSVSGHKIHGPKGIGFLYIKEKTKIKPIIYGGGQQNAMRSGTENVPGIVGMAQAVKVIFADVKAEAEKISELKDYFIEKVVELPGITVNSRRGSEGAPHIISVSVEGVRSEVLLHTLEEKGVYVSAGSACSSNKPAVSATLKAIGVKKELLDSTVRFSLSVNTTKEELDYAVACLGESLDRLRIYKRK